MTRCAHYDQLVEAARRYADASGEHQLMPFIVNLATHGPALSAAQQAERTRAIVSFALVAVGPRG
jgi:hypothetical protein